MSQNHCGLFSGSVPIPLVLQEKWGAACLQSCLYLAGVNLALESRRARREESETRPQDICTQPLSEGGRFRNISLVPHVHLGKER